MRTFFGLDLNAKTKLAIEDWRNKAFPALDGAVPMTNFHITLYFLGQIQQADLEIISELPKKGIKLQLRASEVGFFSKPGIGFLAITDNPELNSLRDHVVRNLPTSLRQSGKNKFVPHITLFRNLATPMPPPSFEPNFIWSISEYHLYQSVRQSRKVSYLPILTFN